MERPFFEVASAAPFYSLGELGCCSKRVFAAVTEAKKPEILRTDFEDSFNS